jgi:hypothetical protein
LSTLIRALRAFVLENDWLVRYDRSAPHAPHGRKKTQRQKTLQTVNPEPSSRRSGVDRDGSIQRLSALGGRCTEHFTSVSRDHVGFEPFMRAGVH